MNYSSFRLVFPAAVTVLALAGPLSAANDRSWVSHNGLDTNPCSVTAPCKTFQHAHDVTVPGGEVDALDAADYGTLVIDRAITIDGGGVAQMEVAPTAYGIYVNPGRVTTVILRNLSINGAPSSPSAQTSTGIYWESGEILYIEDVKISMTGNGFSMDRTLINPKLYIKDTTVHLVETGNIDSYGIQITGGSADGGKVMAILDHIAVETASTGIGVLNARVNVNRSVIAGCANGILSLTAAEVNLDDSEISNNNLAFNTGGTAALAGLIRIGGNNVHDNSTGIFGFGQVVSFGNNRIAGDFNAAADTPSSTIGLK